MDDSRTAGAPTGPCRRRRPGPTRSARAVTATALALVALAACSSSEDDDAAPRRAEDSSPPPTTAPPPEPSVTVDTDDASDTSSTTTGGPPATDAAFAAIGPAVQAYLDRHAMNGAALIVVDREAGVVHEEYWGEFDADRVSLIASSSKMLVAGVLMRLDDAGVLDVDAPVADIVEWGAGNPSITPAQLVSNSSGLVGLMPSPAYAPYVCQFRPVGTLQDCARTIFTTPDDDADIVAPDTEFRYGGGQWQVAGAVAEIAAGRTWAELIEETYVEPCGVETLAFNNHWTQFGQANPFVYPEAFDSDPATLADTDNPNMEGGAYISAPDYAELLLMHLRGGRCGDTQVLSPAALERMHADRTGATYGSAIRYGMGWWIEETNGRITDPGAFGATPWLDLADGYGAYLAVEGDTGPGLAEVLYPLVETAMTG